MLHDTSLDGDLVTAWLALQRAARGSALYRKNYWSFGVVWDMCADDPDQAWQFILHALNVDASAAVLKMLAAGPLEDLLAKHGDYVIDRVEAEARSNPAFARLLGGVWRTTITQKIWSRVEQVFDRTEWEMIPKGQ